MTFEDKVKFLSSHPLFKVAQLSEIRNVAFAVKEVESPSKNQYILGISGTNTLILEPLDIEKIVRVYPDLEAKFK